MRDTTQTRYRIVLDGYNGYEAQYRLWWFPFWFQCFTTNTSSTIESAEGVCRIHASKVVRYYDPYSTEKPDA